MASVTRWAYDYDEIKRTFFVHNEGNRICDAEDSEVAAAICQAYNSSHAAREALDSISEIGASR